MSGKTPDAWDDDWVQKADTPVAATEPAPKPAKISKAERRAKQAEFNRQLWEDAGAQNQNFFLNSRTEVPLKSEFKPAMQLLSRKPAKTASTSTVASGLGQLSVDDDEDDEEDEAKTKTLTAEERQLKAQQEREEKQKKYDLARERILGNASAAAGIAAGKPSGHTMPTRGKVNGGSRGASKSRTAVDGRNSTPSGIALGPRQLYDPNYTVKSESAFTQKESTSNGSGRSTPVEQQPIRNPRGPDGSGRGGFDFPHRFPTDTPTITANMQLYQLFALAAHASLIAAGPLAEPMDAKAQQPAVPAGLPANLPADVKQQVLALIPSANALARTNALPGLGSIIPALPGVSGALPTSIPSVPGIQLPNIPVVGNLPLPPLPVPALPSTGLPDPKALLAKITSAIQILTLITTILGVGGDAASLNLPLGVGLGSGNPIVQTLLGLVLSLLSGAGSEMIFRDCGKSEGETEAAD
ncbi:MAG: hypothetical protein Q9168_007364 [Polycauliona sp. 1 TL-2023]